jgi:hypothetical protein
MKQQYLTSNNLNRALSKQAAKMIKAVPKECWRNATRSLLTRPELAHAHYVEGWIVLPALPVPLEHGWLELDGQIIDPTPVTWKSRHAYFAALRLSKDDLLQALREDTALPIVWRYGWGGMKHPAYAQAYQDAWWVDVPVPAKQRAQISKGTKPVIVLPRR